MSATFRLVLNRWQRAAVRWVRSGNSASLERWFARELEADGAPLRMSIADWWRCVRGLAEAKQPRPGWSKQVDRQVLALLRALLRFSRPAGTPTTDFDAVELDASCRTSLEQLARAYPRSGEARVIGWWLSLPGSLHIPPPLPAWSSSRHVLAVLRGGWKKGDDLLVVDHRRREARTRFELMGSGCSWLGPDWRPASDGRRFVLSQTRLMGLQLGRRSLEWSYRSSGLRITRTALLLRGRKLALLGDQIDGKNLPGKLSKPSSTCLPGSRPSQFPAVAVCSCGVPAAVRRPRSCRSRCRPQLMRPTADSFASCDEHRHLALSCTARGRRCWLPLLVSWDPRRHRKRLSWRVLTVAQDSKVCAPDVAFAVRVSWGRDDTLVIYRSLGPAAPRSFLGYQTKARFLVGRFTSEGNVEPLVSLD